MKTIITTVALVSALMSGVAVAGTVSTELDYLGQGVELSSGSHFTSKEHVSIDSANLPDNTLSSDVYAGSN